MKKTIEKFRKKFEPKKDRLETKIDDAKKTSNSLLLKVKLEKLERKLLKKQRNEGK
jgi:hypothetical protein